MKTPEQIIIRLLAGNITDSDIECMLNIASRKIEEGWETNDIISYLRYTEHFNEDLEEDWALMRMGEIATKYKN